MKIENPFHNLSGATKLAIVTIPRRAQFEEQSPLLEENISAAPNLFVSQGPSGVYPEGYSPRYIRRMANSFSDKFFFCLHQKDFIFEVNKQTYLYSITYLRGEGAMVPQKFLGHNAECLGLQKARHHFGRLVPSKIEFGSP